ncbi:MAG: flagellar basal-body MS-ring/collar protein FliF [Eubacteriales bacterium]
MSFSWIEIKKSMLQFWNKLARPQKIILIVAPLLVAISLISLITWASKPNYVIIFNKLSDTEAGAITAKLQELSIDYQLADNGGTILVPDSQASEVKLELANAGLPQESTFSFDNIDQMHLGETESDRRLRYVLGLQNELETTIETMEGIEYARVHIVMPEPSLFSEEEKDTTAAVTIKKTISTELGEDQVRAIANLVAYSVEGLKSENVTIADTNGNVLSDMLGESNSAGQLTANQMQLQQNLENGIQGSVQSMLDKVFGVGKTVVRANATLDFDQIKITSQTNGEGAVISRQQTSEKSTNGSDAGGVPGTDTNMTEYNSTSSGTTNSNSEKTSLTENFQPNVVQEERVVNPGQIKRLAISVMADADSVTEEQLVDIENVVSSAAGIDNERGDVIQVTRITFDKTSLLEEKAAMDLVANKAKILSYVQLAAGVALLLFMVIIFLKLKSRRKRKSYQGLDTSRLEGQNPVSFKEAEQLMAAQMQAEQEAELNMFKKKTKTTEEIEKNKVRKEVEKYSSDNPDEVARLVKTWLAEEQ